MAVNESNTIQYTVTTSKVTDGTTLYWKTTGNTTNSDIVGGNTGSITVTNNRAFINVTIAADANTDGPKTLGISLSTGSLSGPAVVNTASLIVVNDTSLTPLLGFTSIPSSINEGSAGTFNVNSSLANGTTGYWTINHVTTSAADFTASSGSFTVTGGVGSFTITPLADVSTEGPETFTVSLRTGSISGTVEATSSSITINDTSVPIQNALYGWSGTGLTLGTNDNVYRSSPTQIGTDTNWSFVDVGRYRSMAIKSNGTLWTWGNNSNGGLGLNDLVYRSSPVQIGSGTNWSKVSLDKFQISVSLAIKTDGTLWTWGNNSAGTLGLNQGGNYTSRSSPIQVGALTNWSQASLFSYGITAIKTDGTLWSWGANQQGRLGLNDSVNRSSPTQVGSGTTWSKVFTGYPTRTMAIKTDGTLWLWGNFTYGNSGLNIDSTYRSSPVQLGALTNWSKIALGYDSTMAIKTDGTLWGWGHNYNGQLGNNLQAPGYPGTTGRISSPVQIGSDTNWSDIGMNFTFAGTGVFTIATKTDGTLWSWGKSGYGGLGTNGPSNVAKSSPVQVGSSTNWSLPSVGFDAAGALLRVN
jgi:hypothetical protein